jgi:hypothetical protein
VLVSNEGPSGSRYTPKDGGLKALLAPPRYVKDVCREHQIWDKLFYSWRNKGVPRVPRVPRVERRESCGFQRFRGEAYSGRGAGPARGVLTRCGGCLLKWL